MDASAKELKSHFMFQPLGRGASTYCSITPLSFRLGQRSPIESLGYYTTPWQGVTICGTVLLVY